MQDEKERLLNEAYQHFIQYGFGNLPVELSADFVAEDIMSYGTAIDEKVFSRNAMDEWINRQREHSEGLDVQLSEIPVSRRISAQEDTATIVSEFVVSMMVEGKRNELFMRLTTVLEFINGKWLGVHTHASIPDINSSKHDPLHINEWKRKNEELQRLVEEKTSDLEHKNKELVIEACLERVRARAMAMQKSDELPEAANLLFKQVQSLGMPAWSAGYCIWDDDKRGITLWMSSEGVLQPPFRAPVNEDPSFIHFHEAYQRGETFYVEEIGGDALVTHYRYMRTLPVVGEILDSIIAGGSSFTWFPDISLCLFFTGLPVIYYL